MRIDGKKIANEILDELKKQVFKLKEKGNVPHLAIVLIGNDPASLAYVRQKILKAEQVGIKTTLLNKEARIKSRELIKTIEQLASPTGGLNNDNNVHSIIVQRPLPPHINSELIDKVIDPKKDVDAFNPRAKFDSPISMAVLAILEHVYYSLKIKNTKFTQWLESKKIVVMGKGETGGGPVIKTLKKLGIEPLIIDSKTQNSKLKTKKADIIISAVGKPNALNKEMIKKDTILISIGLHKGKDGKLHGDYEENEIKNIASFYTPTPGGVGPVNVAMLLKNVLTAAS